MGEIGGGECNGMATGLGVGIADRVRLLRLFGMFALGGSISKFGEVAEVVCTAVEEGLGRGMEARVERGWAVRTSLHLEVEDFGLGRILRLGDEVIVEELAAHTQMRRAQNGGGGGCGEKGAAHVPSRAPPASRVLIRARTSRMSVQMLLSSSSTFDL